MERFGRTKLSLAALAVSGAVLLLRFPPDHYGFWPACPFHELTGLVCPGCGATRAVAALLRGHLVEAARLNAMVLLMVPLLAWAWIRGLPKGGWVFVSVLVGAFGVWRNL